MFFYMKKLLFKKKSRQGQTRWVINFIYHSSFHFSIVLQEPATALHSLLSAIALLYHLKLLLRFGGLCIKFCYSNTNNFKPWLMLRTWFYIQKYSQQRNIHKNLCPSAISQNGPPIPSHVHNKTVILRKNSTNQGKVTSESGTPMEVCVEEGGISDINSGIIMENYGDDETMNYIEYMVTD